MQLLLPSWTFYYFLVPVARTKANSVPTFTPVKACFAETFSRRPVAWKVDSSSSFGMPPICGIVSLTLLFVWPSASLCSWPWP